MADYTNQALNRIAAELAATREPPVRCPVIHCGRRMRPRPWQIEVHAQGATLRAIWECGEGHVDSVAHEL